MFRVEFLSQVILNNVISLKLRMLFQLRAKQVINRWIKPRLT